MALRTVAQRRTDSHRTCVRGTRIITGLSALVLSGAIVWDLANDEFWSRHALLTNLVVIERLSIGPVWLRVAKLNGVPKNGGLF
jgi:hypothetical protein